MLKFPVRLTPGLPEEGGYVVTFRDIPEAITQGESRAEALHRAEEALILALEHYLDEGRMIPSPSPLRKGEQAILLPAGITMKVLLLNEMIAQKVRPSELARRMGTSKQEVNRLTTLTHATKIDRIAEAFQAMGRELIVHVA